MKVHQIGRHTLEYGDDGVSVLIYRGDVTTDEMRQTLETQDPTQVPDVAMVICDLRDLGKIHSGARRLGAESPKPGKLYLTAYVGTSFATRVVVDMWTRATNLLQGNKQRVDFFNDHESARRWLLAEKEKFEQNHRK